MCKLKPGCLTIASLKYAGGGDNWSYKKSSKIFTTNIRTPNFEQAGSSSYSPTNSVRNLKAKVSHSTDLLSPNSTGVFHPCLDHERLLVYFGRVAKFLISPLMPLTQQWTLLSMRIHSSYILHNISF